MRLDNIKQIRCITASTAEEFEERVNEVLAHIKDPEIEFDNNRPYTCTIVFTVRRNTPETVLELFEMVDGSSHTCIECPHFVHSTDKRKKWSTCSLKAEPTRSDSRACERYYLWQYKVLTEAKEEYHELPYTIK